MFFNDETDPCPKTVKSLYLGFGDLSIHVRDPSGLPDGRGVVDMARNVFRHCAGVSIVADATSRGRGTRPCTSIVIQNH